MADVEHPLYLTLVTDKPLAALVTLCFKLHLSAAVRLVILT